MVRFSRLRILNEGIADESSTVKRQDYAAVMGYMSEHSLGRDTVWDFYKDNYQELLDTSVE